MRRAAGTAVLLATLLAGCTAASFAQRYEAGEADAFEQDSPTWRSPGLYAALPQGRLHGFDVTTTAGPQMVVAVAPGGTPPRPFGFQDDALDEAWGAYELQLVRWRHMPEDDRGANVYFHLDRESVQGWGGVQVLPEQVLARFRDFTSTLLEVGHDEREELEERFMEARRELAMPEQPGGPRTIPGFHHVVSFVGPTQVHAAFSAMGGLPAFTPVPRHEAISLPSPGQVDLVQGPWEFAFETPMTRAQRGSFADRDLVLVTPDDSVQYVHWGEEDLSDHEAARRLREAIADLGHEPPDLSSWAFRHLRHEGGPGD